MKLLRRFVLILSCLAGACRPSPMAEDCEPTSSDVPVMVSSAAVQTSKRIGRLEEIWRAAGTNEGQELAAPASFAVSATGAVAVVDYVLAEVAVIDSNGVWLGNWARKGRGPGELIMPLAATWSGDTLVVFDIEQAKVSFLAEGTVARPDLAVATEFVTPVLAAGEVSYAAVRSDGTVLLMVPLSRTATASDSASQIVLAMRPGAQQPDTVAVSHVPLVRWGPYSAIPQPGAARSHVAAGSNGWLAISSPDGSYRVHVIDGSGRPVHEICRTAPAIALTAAERGRATAGDDHAEAMAAIASARVPQQISQIGRMVVGPGGEVWVDQTRAAPFSAEGLYGATGSTMDVFDVDGTYSGEVLVPEKVSLQAVHSDFALGLEFSTLDEPWLIGYRVLWQH